MKISSQFTSKSATLRSALLIISAVAILAGGWMFATRPTHAYTADAFVMRVKTDNVGTSGANQFTIPATTSGIAPNYNVDCNDDGTIDITAATAAATCTYPVAGTYTIAITGTFPRIAFNNAGDRLKLLEIRQWGTGQWRAFDNAFYGAANMQLTATDSPNLSSVTTMMQMFRGATAFTGAPSMANWNTASVTSFWSMFELASNFNAPISSWNVSSATTMYGTFAGAAAFNQPLNSWNVGNVTDFRRMFAAATIFNQDLNSWNTAKATSFNSMFQQATAFNGQIGAWTTTLVTDLSYMFSKASAFNRDISGWNVANVTNMTATFQDALVFNQPIGVWNTAKLRDLNTGFTGARAFNYSIDNWNVSAVTNMQFLFNNAAAFNQPLNSWNTGAVTNMQYLFSGATVFNQPLTNWNTGSVTSMSNMFSTTTAFNQPLSSWNTANVLNMSSMFNNAKAFNQDLNGWNTSKVTTMNSIFASATVFNGSIGGWDTAKVTDMSSAFASTPVFNKPLDTWNVSSVTTMTNMFSSAKAFNQPLNSWNTGNVTAMTGIFHQASAFDGAISNWNTSKLTSMQLMFRGASAFNQPIGGWDTSKVTNMASMLEATLVFNQPLDAWDTSNVTTMGALFYASSRFNQPLGTWNVQKVTDMTNMLLSTAISTPNYDSTLQGWLAGGVRNNVSLRATPARYCAAESARATLIATHGWTVVDGGKGCPAPTVTINAPTKLKNAAITDTTITVTESYADLTISAASVVIGAGTTVARSGYACTQVDTKNVTCSLAINSSGTLAITATNSGGGVVTRSEAGYIVDTVKPTVTASVDTTMGTNTPRLTFTATDNIAVARTEVQYHANNGGAGVGGWVTINPATSPVDLALDPDEAVHHVIVRTYDTAGNVTDRDLLFPPIVTFNVPTPISNGTIINASVTITSPSGNPIDNIVLNAGGTGATRGACVGAGNDTTSPYNQPVTCQIGSITNSGTVTVSARDAVNTATGQNAQTFTIDTTNPVVHVSSPTKRSSQPITDITVTVTDDIAVDTDLVWAYLNSQSGDLELGGVACTQVHASEVSCRVTLNGTDGITSIIFDTYDVAGNYGYVVESGYEIDTTAPTVGAIVLADASDSGVKGDSRTNVSTPVFVIPCTETGSSAEIYLNGESFTEVTCEDANPLETTLRSFEDGTYEISYVAIDELGNRSAMSPPYSFTIDTVLPGASIQRASGQQPTIVDGEAVFAVTFTKAVQTPIDDFITVTGIEGAATDATIETIDEVSPTEFTVTVQDIAEGETVRLLLRAGLTDLAGNVMDEAELALIGADAVVTRDVPVVEELPVSSLVPGAPNTGLFTVETGLPVLVLLLGLGSISGYLLIGRRRNRA